MFKLLKFWFLVILAKVGLQHVSLVLESLVQSEGCGEVVGSMAAVFASELEIVVQELLIHRMSAVFDDNFSSLEGIETAEVGHTLFRNENLD